MKFWILLRRLSAFLVVQHFVVCITNTERDTLLLYLHINNVTPYYVIMQLYFM